MIKRFLYRPELLLGLFLVLISFLFIWSNDSWRANSMSSDGRGYYAYLPALFIYNDLTYESNIKALDKKLHVQLSNHTILKDREGNTFNKCFPGVAIVQLPLFIFASLLSFIFGLPIDGYNDLFLISITLTGITSAVIGFHFLKKLLISLDLNKRYSILSAFAILLGSNAFYYSIWGASLSHIHSYMAISAFLYYSNKWLKSGAISSTLFAALFLSLIFLIRPTNVLVILLIPFLAGSWDNLKQSFLSIFKNKRWIYPISFGFLPLLSLPLLWYAQTEHFVVWSYSKEGFYFSNPRMLSALFSFRNGVFIWSPVAFLSLMGLYFIYKKSSFQAISLALFFILNLYVISSWWSYGYGGGFGHRAFVEHQVFFGILLTYGISQFPYRKLYLSILYTLVILNILQTYQYSRGILPPSSATKAVYGNAFLRLSDSYIGEFKPVHDEYYYGKTVRVTELSPDSNNFEFSPQVQFNAEAHYNISNLPKDHQIYLELDYTKMRLSPSSFDDVFMVISGTDVNGNPSMYQSFSLYEIRNEAYNEWKTIHLGSQISSENVENYKMYIWNKGGHHFKLKGITYTIRHISVKGF